MYEYVQSSSRYSWAQHFIYSSVIRVPKQPWNLEVWKVWTRRPLWAGLRSQTKPNISQDQRSSPPILPVAFHDAFIFSRPGSQDTVPNTPWLELRLGPLQNQNKKTTCAHPKASKHLAIPRRVFQPKCWVERLRLHFGSIDDVVEEFLASTSQAAGLIPCLAWRVGREWTALRILLLLLGRLEMALMSGLPAAMIQCPGFNGGVMWYKATLSRGRDYLYQGYTHLIHTHT